MYKNEPQGLNAAPGRCIYAAPCNEDSTFEILNVPAGEYELVIWDENLDILVNFLVVVVNAGADADLGDIPVFGWFGRMEHHVFLDEDEDGFRDPGEMGIPEQNINLRWRDGTIYPAFPTDLDGYVPFDEIFPFFHWQVAEVDFARYKATGCTLIVDGGGAVLPDQGWDYPSRDKLTPQPQFDPATGDPLINPNTDNNLSRTEVGPVLLEAFQIFPGQTSVIEWGKSTYDRVDVDNPPLGDFPGPGDVDHNGNDLFDASNGGITGIVFYATTRAENDPQYAAAEVWEPGIPRVQVNLYSDYDNDKKIDDRNGNGVRELADVDNAPFGNFPGPEDIDRNYPGQTPGVLDMGDAMQIDNTDSWDDNKPTGAQGPPFSLYGVLKDCYDGLRNWNQVRPGVFDGGYAFTSYTSGSVEIQGIREDYCFRVKPKRSRGLTEMMVIGFALNQDAARDREQFAHDGRHGLHADFAVLLQAVEVVFQRVVFGAIDGARGVVAERSEAEPPEKDVLHPVKPRMGRRRTR